VKFFQLVSTKRRDTTSAWEALLVGERFGHKFPTRREQQYVSRHVSS
jgi:hypothetical protein